MHMLETVISNYLHFMRERQMVSHAFFCLDLPTYALCSVSTFLSYFQDSATRTCDGHDYHGQ
jgi:hypothetical protein